MLGICASQITASEAAASGGSEVATARACPGDIGTYANCLGGQDNNGAYFLVAVPKISNGILIVHAHGGPRHVPPAPNGADEDLVRFSAMVAAGYSWIGTTYRDGGYGVRLAAADVEQSRAIFWRQFGRPKRTILHGQSYGGNVVAKLAELDALTHTPRTDEINSFWKLQYSGIIQSNLVLDKIQTISFDKTSQSRSTG